MTAEITTRMTQDLVPAAMQDKIYECEVQIKLLKKIQEEYKAELLRKMQEAGYDSIETDDGRLKITVVPETERETFDAKAFRADHKRLYNQYAKFTPVKASLKITAR